VTYSCLLNLWEKARAEEKIIEFDN